MLKAIETLVVLLLALPIASAQNHTTQTAAAKAETSGIEVSIQFLAPSKFCAYGPDAYVVYFPVDITIANGRRTPVILTSYLHIQRLFLAANERDMSAAKYELATPLRAFHTAGSSINFNAPVPPEDGFVVLKHNQTYEFTAVAGISVQRSSGKAIPDTVTPGSHFGSVELQTWPYIRDAAGMRNQWSRLGDLISTPVVSFPSLIQLAPNPPVENCGLIVR